MNESEAKSILEAEVAAAGERLLWWGRPAAGRSALRALPATFAGLPVAAFAAFWIWAAAGGLGGGSRPGGPWSLFPLFGLPFLIFGLGMVLSPLFALGAAGRTLYAVTSGAVLVVKAGRSRRVERHPLPTEEAMRRTQRADGSGDLDVARTEVATSKGQRSRPVTFVGIPEVARVERIVADAARAWRAGLTSAPGAAHPAAEARGPGAPVPRHADLGGAPAVPAPHRAPGSVPGAPHYREGGTRRLPVLVLLVIGLLAGFAIALALVRAGRLPPGWHEPEPNGTPVTATDLGPTGPAAPPGAAHPPVAGGPETRSASRPEAEASRTETVGAAMARPAPGSPEGDEAACADGDGAACARAARAAWEGRAGARNLSRGAALATRGCDLGAAAACGYLAWILDGNGGVELSDHAAAVRAGERGCELGSRDGCVIAGVDLAQGRPGVTADPRRAEPILERACGPGNHHPRACPVLADLLARRGERARARSLLAACCADGYGPCCEGGGAR